VPNSSTMTEWSMTRSTGTSGLIFFGIAAEGSSMPSRIAARSTTAGTPVKSCISTRAGRIGDLDAGLALVVQPGGDGFDAGFGDRAAILVAQQVLEQDLHREGKLGDAGKPVLLRLLEVEVDILGGAHLERAAAIETIERFRHLRPLNVLRRIGEQTPSRMLHHAHKLRVRSFPLSVPSARPPSGTRRNGFGANEWTCRPLARLSAL
jgi:hypothetical protein